MFGRIGSCICACIINCTILVVNIKGSPRFLRRILIGLFGGKWAKLR